MSDLTGIVKMYNDTKGFGFIKPEEDGDDFFFHISAVVDENWEPRPGDRVKFVRGADPKTNRIRAEKVERCVWGG